MADLAVTQKEMEDRWSNLSVLVSLAQSGLLQQGEAWMMQAYYLGQISQSLKTLEGMTSAIALTGLVCRCEQI